MVAGMVDVQGWPAAQQVEGRDARREGGGRGKRPSLWMLAGLMGRSEDRSGRTGARSLASRGGHVFLWWGTLVVIFF